MKFITAPGTAAIALSSLFGASLAHAQDAGWYVGAGVGRSAVTIDDARIRSGLAAQLLTTTSITDRDRDTGYKLFGGWAFNRNLALEFGYADLGHFGFTATTSPPGTLAGDIRVKALNLDLVGTLPVYDRLSVLGRVGVTSARTRGNFSATGAVTNPYTGGSDRATNLKLGAGLQYAFSDALAMRLEGERYRINDSVGNRGHADMFSVSLLYRFGTAPAVQPRAAAPAYVAPPAPVVVAPAPPPVVVAAAPPAPGPLMRVTLSADALFDFDSSTIKPTGRSALDKLVSDLRGVNYTSIQVTGHADRIGSRKYNQALSMRRAQAVTDYLSQAGIAAAALSARSADGEDHPVTQPGDCKGNRPTPALIACLQPDRRVVVEVSGTRR